jgi:hypothetical protein
MNKGILILIFNYITMALILPNGNYLKIDKSTILLQPNVKFWVFKDKTTREEAGSDLTKYPEKQSIVLKLDATVEPTELASIEDMLVSQAYTLLKSYQTVKIERSLIAPYADATDDI